MLMDDRSTARLSSSNKSSPSLKLATHRGRIGVGHSTSTMILRMHPRRLPCRLSRPLSHAFFASLPPLCILCIPIAKSQRFRLTCLINDVIISQLPP